MAELRSDFIDTKNIDTSKNWDKWTNAMSHNRKLHRINRGIYLKSFGKFLLDRGFTHIVVSYEGSGDCGDCFWAEGFKDDEWSDLMKHIKSKGYGSVSEQLGYSADISDGKNRQKEVRELFNTYKHLNPEWKPDNSNNMDALEYVLSNMVSYDWYNNEGGCGEVIWDLKKERIDVEGQQYYHGSYECSEVYDLNGKEPKTRYRDGGH